MWRETSYKAILINDSFFFLYFQDLGVLVLSSVVAAAAVVRDRVAWPVFSVF